MTHTILYTVDRYIIINGISNGRVNIVINSRPSIRLDMIAVSIRISNLANMLFATPKIAVVMFFRYIKKL